MPLEGLGNAAKNKEDVAATVSPSFPLTQKVAKVASAAHKALACASSSSSGSSAGPSWPPLLGLSGVARSNKDKSAGLNIALYEASKAQRAAYAEAQRLTGVFTELADGFLEKVAASSKAENALALQKQADAMQLELVFNLC